MGKKEKYYYKVALALPANWKQNIYTYASKESLSIGSVVTVPFGKNTKVGYVEDKDRNPPNTSIKEITEKKPFIIPEGTIQFIEWMNNNYPNMPGTHVQHVLPTNVQNWNSEKGIVDNKNHQTNDPPALTKTQLEAVKHLLNDRAPHVLHGITGSGKTRVYLELILKSIAEGKNVLLLYPEISLTRHMEQSLRPFIPEGALHTYHSKSTPTERKLSWTTAANGTSASVFIGPRSALFLPIHNLGLVIVDEAHDGSYKQDNGSRYNGLLAAAALAKCWNAKLVFGSATPPVNETNLLEQLSGSLLCMHELALTTAEAKRHFEIVDMTDKSQINSQSYLLSNRLLEAIDKSLKQKKQSIIFLNRRGTARSVICQNCGWHASCTRCNNSLTYHHDDHRLKCHVCGTNHRSVHICPDCSSGISLQTPGTKAILEDLQQLFPKARIKRFDSDNKKADSLSENYATLRNGDVDIAVGTQLLTKGLDLPNLSTVGVLQADSSLFLPDFSSTERTFQLLTQVSGRVGRGHADGIVILQTYNPDSDLFKLVLQQDWHGFYQKELESRKTLNFPPYAFIAKLWVLKKSPHASQKAIEALAHSITDPSISILGPAPSFYEKISGAYSWQIIIRSNSRGTLLEVIKKLPKDIYYDLDPVSLL